MYYPGDDNNKHCEVPIGDLAEERFQARQPHFYGHAKMGRNTRDIKTPTKIYSLGFM